jgi:hypothetical protein
VGSLSVCHDYQRPARGEQARVLAGFDLVEVPLLDPASVDTDMTRGVLANYDMQAAASLVRASAVCTREAVNTQPHVRGCLFECT